MLQKVGENNVQAYNPYCHSSYGCSYNYKNVVNPWKTIAYLMILLAFWDVLKNYIRQHNNK